MGEIKKIEKYSQKVGYTSQCIQGPLNKFPDFFCTGIENCCRLLKSQYVIAIHLMR